MGTLGWWGDGLVMQSWFDLVMQSWFDLVADYTELM